MLSMLVNSIVAKHMFQEEEGIEIRVFHCGSIIEDTDIRVIHLIVSDKEKGWSENSFFCVFGLRRGVLLEGRKARFYLRDKIVMVDVASADNDHVVTIVVSGMEISKMVD
jgi:hypothetical protein